jgi:hypothetical protein
VVAFSKKLHWLAQTKVLTLKTQLHAESHVENDGRNSALDTHGRFEFQISGLDCHHIREWHA